MISEKIPQTLLCRFYRWVKEHSPQEWLKDLRDWITEESEYRVKSSESAKGLAAKGRIKREERRSNSDVSLYNLSVKVWRMSRKPPNQEL